MGEDTSVHDWAELKNRFCRQVLLWKCRRCGLMAFGTPGDSPERVEERRRELPREERHDDCGLYLMERVMRS